MDQAYNDTCSGPDQTSSYFIVKVIHLIIIVFEKLVYIQYIWGAFFTQKALGPFMIWLNYGSLIQAGKRQWNVVRCY